MQNVRQPTNTQQLILISRIMSLSDSIKMTLLGMTIYITIPKLQSLNMHSNHSFIVSRLRFITLIYILLKIYNSKSLNHKIIFLRLWMSRDVLKHSNYAGNQIILIYYLRSSRPYSSRAFLRPSWIQILSLASNLPWGEARKDVIH